VNKTPSPYALWLIPQKEQAIALQAIIDDLARHGDTPPFPVHATLCSGTIQPDPRELKNLFTVFASNHSPLALANTGLRHSDDFFRFLLIRLGSAPPLIFTEALRAFPDAHLPEIGPHLSLAYSEPRDSLDLETMPQNLTRALPKSIYFDKIELVIPTTGRWRDIGAWTTIYSQPLGTSSISRPGNIEAAQ
jgi:hypothetical protein